MIEWNTLLTLVTFFPLVGVAIILLMKPLFDRESDQAIRLVATLTSVATFLISLVVLFNFDRSDSGLQLIDRANWIPSLGIQYFLGVDGISILMLLLTTFITPLAIISSYSS